MDRKASLFNRSDRRERSVKEKYRRMLLAFRRLDKNPYLKKTR
jgi:hypothetical protein